MSHLLTIMNHTHGWCKQWTEQHRSANMCATAEKYCGLPSINWRRSFWKLFKFWYTLLSNSWWLTEVRTQKLIAPKHTMPNQCKMADPPSPVVNIPSSCWDLPLDSLVSLFWLVGIDPTQLYPQKGPPGQPSSSPKIWDIQKASGSAMIIPSLSGESDHGWIVYPKD